MRERRGEGKKEKKRKGTREEEGKGESLKENNVLVKC